MSTPSVRIWECDTPVKWMISCRLNGWLKGYGSVYTDTKCVGLLVVPEGNKVLKPQTHTHTHTRMGGISRGHKPTSSQWPNATLYSEEIWHHFLSHVIKVNINSHKSCCCFVPLQWSDEYGLLFLWPSSPKPVTPIQSREKQIPVEGRPTKHLPITPQSCQAHHREGRAEKLS